MSLDGYIADEAGGVKWLDEYGKGKGDNGYAEFLASIDTIIMGKKTYDQVLTFGDFPYATQKCYVYSHSETGTTKFVEFTQIPETELIGQLKNHVGKNIWLVGGANLVASFLKYNLIDEFIITMIPIVLGKGIPLFNPIHEKLPLKFQDVRTYGDLVQIYYTKI